MKVKFNIIKHINNKIKKIEKDFVPNKNHWNAGYNKGYYDSLVYCLKLLEEIEIHESKRID